MGNSLKKQIESIVVDGTCEHQRYLVKINGLPIYLTGKIFCLLYKISERKNQTRWMDLERRY